MKKSSFLVGVACMAITASVAQHNKQEDIKAIKSMCGCYEVSFDFAETFEYSKDTAYKASKVKHDRGLEWVELVEETPNKLVLQHLLIANDTMIIKHWRQDWLYENTDLYTYYKDNVWKYNKLNKTDVKGQWTQKVFQVDDSPRYEGTASWLHVDGAHYWKNTTDAPLPRREHTVRNDYNVLKRRNIHEIKPNGWLHEQDNLKIVRDENGSDFVLAQEKGLDFYKKVEDSKCLAAQNWWKDNKVFWAKVRGKWDAVFAQNKDLKLEKSIDKKPLFMHLFPMPVNSDEASINAVIEGFVKK